MRSGFATALQSDLQRAWTLGSLQRGQGHQRAGLMGSERRLRQIIEKFDWGRVLALAVLAGFVALRMWDPPPLETLRLKTFDAYQQISPRPGVAKDVVVVDIDESSLAEYGQWPWPRTLIARLIDRISSADPSAIAFDIVFAEPDRLSPRLFTRASPQLTNDLAEQLNRLPDNEKVMADALRNGRVVVGRAGHHEAGIDLEARLKSLPQTTVATLGPDPRKYLFRTQGVAANLEILEAAAAGRGLFSIRVDRDGIIRRVPAVMLAGNQIMPALAIDTLRVAQGADALLIKTNESGIKAIVVSNTEIPTDRHGQIWVNYAPFTRQHFVSAADVIANRFSPDLLRGKIVLIGTSAAGLFDLRSTPLDRVRPGVDIHAELLETILTKSYLVRPNIADGAEVWLALLVGLLMIVFVPLIGALPAMALGAIVSGLVFGGSWYLFKSERLLIDPIYPMVSSLAVFGSLVLSSYVSEERRRAQIRNAFSQYLSPALVAELARDPDRLKLGGETRELTVLFSDVRGFTRIAETYKDDPESLTNLMNRLLTPLSNAITARNGTIDKYMGDAIMAFWNAPLEDRDHPINACRSALEMLKEMDRLNDERANALVEGGRTVDTLEVGIGICTGNVIVGNMGSDLRFDYSVLGDSVNLASRLEGLTRSYDCRVLIASSTAACVRDEFALIELDRVRVKGKVEPETIFTLIGDRASKQDRALHEFDEAFQEMRRDYVSRRWDEAFEATERLRMPAQSYGLAGVVDVYQERIDQLRSGDVGSDWDGVFNWETK
jgi:adenylate cyclase